MDAAMPTRVVGERMRAILRQLKELHDLVLVDAPYWNGGPEVVALGCACDAVYLCEPERDESEEAMSDLMQVIPEQGASLRAG